MPKDLEASIRSLDDLTRIHEILARFLEINDWEELRRLL